MRRLGKFKIIGVLGAAGVVLILASFAHRRPVLIWNYTASAPLGLYQIVDRPWRKGDWVAVAPEPRVAAMLTKFGVLKPGRLLIKRGAAAPGDVVCRDGLNVTINGKWAAKAKMLTSSGMRLPNWGGCQRVGEGDVFLLGEAGDSFDGRYFGVSSAEVIIGPMRYIEF